MLLFPILPALALDAAQPRLSYPTRPHIIRPTDRERSELDPALAGIGSIAAARRRNAGPTGILGPYATNLWSAASLTRVLNAATDCALAERTSGAVDATIGFDGGGGIDQTALLAHAGAAATVQSFLDQSGNARPFLNGTSSGQPAIVSASTYLGKLQFDGANDTLSTGVQTYGPNPAITIFLKGRLRSTAATQFIIEHSANYNSNQSCVVYYDSAISRLVIGSHQLVVNRYAISEFNVTMTTDARWVFRIDRTQTSGANQCVCFKDGVKQTRTGATGETGTVPDNNLAAAALSIGSRNAASGFASMDLYSLVIYSSALSDADCIAISALLA